MSKRKGSKQNPVTETELSAVLAGKPHRNYSIIHAAIIDGFCNYGYEITEGIPDTHNVKGKGIVLDDMPSSFQKYNVHLAALDDAFRLSKIEIDDIDKYHAEEITHQYHVNAFKIKGGKDNESISLGGTKYCNTLGGRLAITTPFIPLDNLSSYKWYNELKAAADAAREEVALYKEGKCTVVEEDADDEVSIVIGRKKKNKQLSIGEVIDDDSIGIGATDDDSMDDFDKVKA